MRKFLFMFSGVFFLTFLNVSGQGSLKKDSITMGPGYANEVYYSLANGISKIVPRNQWDIAFRTGVMSSSILVNDGAGVVLYSYPKADTSGWATVDTSGLSSWPQMFNDPYDWENGAFNRNALGHPDYGWGIYNIQNHNLTGDSIFVIKLRDGSFKKLIILKKQSAEDIYTFKYANLDGSHAFSDSLDLSNHTSVEFYGYNLENNTEVDFQPLKTTWDILFTKYVGINAGQPYPVTGVLSNNLLKVKKVTGVPQSYNDWWNGDWDSTRSVIGYDWKTFNGTGYSVNDSTVYFVQDLQGDIYKLYFTSFEGSSTGKIVFMIGKISSIGISEKQEQKNNMFISPNPASSRITILQNDASRGDLITVVNISGNVVMQMYASGTQTTADISKLEQGIYFVRLKSSKEITSKKFIISR